MSDTRTGHRTSTSEFRHRTGQRDVGTPNILDGASSFHKPERSSLSGSSAGRANHSEVSGSRSNNDFESMANKHGFDPAEVEHENSRTATGRRGMNSRELETSHAGSWCANNIERPQTSDFFSDPALGPHPNDRDEKKASSSSNMVGRHSNSKGKGL